MKQLLCCLLFASPFTRLHAQIIYCNDIGTNVFTFNVQTCTSSLLPGGPAYNDMAVGAGAIVYGLFGSDVIEINTSNGGNNYLGTIPGLVTGLELGQDGLLYALGTNVWAFNPATGTVVNNGALPNNWFCTGDIVYLDGIYYATVYDITNGGNNQLISVNLSNPSASTIIGPVPVNDLVAGASVNSPSCPKLYWFNSPAGSLSDLYEYDVNSQTWTLICQSFPNIIGGADTPNNYSFAFSCGCTTDAGNMPGANLNVCVDALAQTPATVGASLESDDLLRYIVFSNPNDTLGSIVASSASPVFAYNPALYTPGLTYYIAAIAGNNNNGQVSLSDPCLDISNAVELVWRALPTAVLQAPPPSICAGACVDIPVNFSGVPPFVLNYTTPFSGTQVQNFSNINGILNVCIPGTHAPGALDLQLTSIQDAWCACP